MRIHRRARFGLRRICRAPRTLFALSRPRDRDVLPGTSLRGRRGAVRSLVLPYKEVPGSTVPVGYRSGVSVNLC